MTDTRKRCHDILDQINDDRLYDALTMLTEIRDRADLDYANYLDGIPVYDMKNKKHLQRILDELPSDKPTIKN